jgi:hypothetical protein
MLGGVRGKTCTNLMWSEPLRSLFERAPVLREPSVTPRNSVSETRGNLNPEPGGKNEQAPSRVSFLRDTMFGDNWRITQKRSKCAK